MKFTLNHAGVEQIVRSAGAARELKRVGDVIADEVRQEGERIRFTGNFADSIEVTEVVPVPEGVGLAVHSTDHAAHIIEFGARNKTPFAPFRKAAAALGLRLGPGRRI
jgi:hypothetical protein